MRLIDADKVIEKIRNIPHGAILNVALEEEIIEIVKSGYDAADKHSIVTISEFSKFVTEMIQFEKENRDLQENIENEDWDALEDEIYEYLASCD